MHTQTLAWAWVVDLSEGKTVPYSQAAQTTATHVLTHWLAKLHRLQEVLQATMSLQSPKVAAAFAAYNNAVVNGILPVVGSPDFNFIEGLRQQDPAIAIHALSALSEGRALLKGKAALALYLQNASTDSIAAAQAAFNAGVAANKEELASIQKLQDSVKSSTDLALAQHATAVKKQTVWEEESRSEWAEWNKAATKKAQAEFDAQKERHQKALEELNRAFKDGMALRAPVKYWEDEALTYRTKAFFAAAACAYLAVGLPVLFFVVGWCLELFPRAWTITSFVDYWRLLPGALAVFLYIWALRVAVRYIVASDHVAGMCRQRGTVIETYLSLLASEGVKNDPKAFRTLVERILEPISTGLLGSDKPPPAPHTIVQNMLDSSKD